MFHMLHMFDMFHVKKIIGASEGNHKSHNKSQQIPSGDQTL